MSETIAALAAGLALVLSQPVAGAVIGGIIGVISSHALSSRTAATTARSAQLEYLRRRHDKFEGTLVEIANLMDDWASEEVALLNSYAKNKPDHEDSDGDRADVLRQQITNGMNQLRVLAPYQQPDHPSAPLHRKLKALENTWSESLTARRYLEHAIGPWDLSVDEVATAHQDGLECVQRVEDSLQDLFSENAAYVQTVR